MARSSPSQRKTAGRVMHEFKHGELKRGRSGKGGKVKSRRQAIAIALHESGASKSESKRENRKALARTKRKEAHGDTAQQEKEGKSRVGARGGARAAAPWAARMRSARRRAAARRRARAREAAARRVPSSWSARGAAA